MDGDCKKILLELSILFNGIFVLYMDIVFIVGAVEDVDKRRASPDVVRPLPASPSNWSRGLEPAREACGEKWGEIFLKNGGFHTRPYLAAVAKRPPDVGGADFCSERDFSNS